MRYWALVAASALLACAVTACGGDGVENSEPPAAEPATSTATPVPAATPVPTTAPAPTVPASNPAPGTSGSSGFGNIADRSFQGFDGYFAELDAILDDIGERVFTPPPDIPPNTSFEAARSAMAQYFTEIGANAHAVIDDIARLQPPDEARAAHDKYVAELRTLAELFVDYGTRTANATSIAEARAVINDAEGQAIIDRVEAACVVLQAIAHRRGSNVFYSCAG